MLGCLVGLTVGSEVVGDVVGSEVVGDVVGANVMHWVVSREPTPKQGDVSSSGSGQLVRHAVRD